MNTRSNLIIVRAGLQSNHRGWTVGGEPNFDLLVAAYDMAAVMEDTEHTIHIYVPGSKVSGWAHVWREHKSLISQYQRIAFVDDDVEMSVQTANLCFDLGEINDLKIWQPSLSEDSYATYAASLRNRTCSIRFCTIIEMMCPFFDIATLNAVSPLFFLGFESGIDLIWCSIAREIGGNCAIVDECVVRHSRPVGKEKEMNGFSDRYYEYDIERCLKLFDMKWPSWTVEYAILKGGQKVSSPALLSLISVNTIFGIFNSPRFNRAYRAKSACDHIRHQTFRHPYYGKNILCKLKAMEISMI